MDIWLCKDSNGGNRSTRIDQPNRRWPTASLIRGERYHVGAPNTVSACLHISGANADNLSHWDASASAVCRTNVKIRRDYSVRLRHGSWQCCNSLPQSI